jgi:hypothetical protein
MTQADVQMYFKEMAIACKNIMLAPLAKAIAGLAQYCVNETSYCANQTGKMVQRKNTGEQVVSGVQE